SSPSFVPVHAADANAPSQMHLGYLKLRQMIAEFEQKRKDGTGPAAALAAGKATPLPSTAAPAAAAANGNG
ncbi:hypothetical protein ABXW19_12390, partial [Streptococcus suis]|uniref:hypothetical protein n=1 Tax=Streptococcus suis TaxID=1307 RepID=UPI003CE7DE1C